MTDLSKYPALKILTGIMAGLFIGLFADIEKGLQLPLVIIFTGLFISALILKFRIISFITGTLLIGLLLSFRIDSSEIKKPQKMIAPFPAAVRGEVTDIIRSEKKYCRLILEGNIDSQISKPIENNKILLTVLSLDKKNLEINIGTQIAATVEVRPPRPVSLPGEFSEEQYTKANDIQWIARAWASDISIVSKASEYEKFISNIRKDVAGRLSELFPEKTEGIAIALLTGDKSSIPYELKQQFSFAGTAHVLAVSGLHVGIISVMVYLLLGFVGDLRIKFLIFSLVILAFIVLTGSHASSLRAGLMAIAAMFVLTMQRKAEPLNILAFVILAIIIISPEMIYSVGFQMSVAAITGIIIFYQPVKNFFVELLGKKENIIFNNVISSLTLTISASISVAPVIAYYFGMFSVISPLANLFCVPLIFFGMIFTTLSVIFSYIYFPLGEIYSASADLSYDLCIWVNSFALKLPLAYIEGRESFMIAMIIAVILIYYFSFFKKEFLVFRTIAALLLFLLSLYIFHPEDRGDHDIYPGENLVAIEIPQNDHIFVLLADRKPGLYPAVDHSLLHYLMDKDSALVIGITGNCGIALTDELKRKRKIRILEIPVDVQKKIGNELNLKHEVPQIIEY